MTETTFTPAERAVMAARAEAAEWRARYEAAVHGRQEFRAAYAGVREELHRANARAAEAEARLADLARQATAAGPVLEAAIRLDDADSECIAHHVMYPNDEDGEIELMVEYRAARQALTAAVAALRAAREGE